MEKLLIRGGTPLEGEITVSGAKNAALPIMCAALLTQAPLRLDNVPKLMDVRTMTRLLERMGVAPTPLRPQHRTPASGKRSADAHHAISPAK